MKKILALVLATTLGLSMIACGNNEVVETTESVVETTETVTTEYRISHQSFCCNHHGWYR